MLECDWCDNGIREDEEIHLVEIANEDGTVDKLNLCETCYQEYLNERND